VRAAYHRESLRYPPPGDYFVDPAQQPRLACAQCYKQLDFASGWWHRKPSRSPASPSGSQEVCCRFLWFRPLWQCRVPP